NMVKPWKSDFRLNNKKTKVNTLFWKSLLFSNALTACTLSPKKCTSQESRDTNEVKGKTNLHD
ncbi:hypothetical protein, partial [Pseudomonas viridiflava]|uniref:hypothetical protein n=1 Tax=Pseudomonas viridiflava TaxID=33069 RepID=UPI00197CBA6C